MVAAKTACPTLATRIAHPPMMVHAPSLKQTHGKDCSQSIAGSETGDSAACLKTRAVRLFAAWGV